MNVAIVLAGGVGSRVGADKPKQFVKVFGKPILVYTLEQFQMHSQIDGIEIVCLRGYEGYVRDLIEKYKLTKVQYIADGGKDFQSSVISGLENLRPYCAADDVVLIQYGSAPFVTADIISRTIEICSQKGNCTAATPLYALMGTKDGDCSLKMVDRDTVVELNCPQAFKYGYLMEKYQIAAQSGLLDKIDPHTTSMLHAMGEPIYIALEQRNDFKITTKDDLRLFAGYILLQKYRSEMQKHRQSAELWEDD